MKKVLPAIIICLFVTSFGTVNAQTEPQYEYVPTAAEQAAIDKARLEREAKNLILIEKIRELTQMVDLLQAKLDLSLGIDIEVFKEFVGLGYENDSVLLLQQVLASDPAIYPEALTTGYYGIMTENALLRFQRTFGLEATGLFTKETRVVLTEVLMKYPFAQTSAPYLGNSSVRNAIISAKDNFNLKDLLENGKVVFSKSPVFAESIRNSDTATLQRILATDPKIYPEARISGVYTPDTVDAVSKLQERYGLQRTAVIDEETRSLLVSILIENNDSVIRNDLLLMDSVQPKVLLKNNEREIFNIFATREYKVPNVIVSVNYLNGSIDNFLLYPDTPEGADKGRLADKKDVVADLAVKMKRDKAEVEKMLIFNIAKIPEFPVSALIYAYINGDISFTFTTIANGKYQSYEFLIKYNDPDLNEEVEFNNKRFEIRELRDYIYSEAWQLKAVDKTIVDALREAVAEELGVPEKDVPDFPVIYSHELPFEPLNT